jgi:uncharacterized protein YeaO (DUF488 family)
VINTKRVYEPPAKSDGLRVLVMRLWPRGIKKTSVDLWLKDLGAELDNLKAWNAGRVTWPEMRKRYLEGIKKPPAATALAELRQRADGRTITLLCSCRDETQCHRTILKSLLVADAPPSRQRER